jgi:hypothetical protein
VVKDAGRFVARVDLAYPDLRIGIEGVSEMWHRGHRAWQRDLERLNGLQALGWWIIHVTWRDLTDRPDQVVNWILRARRSRLAQR